MSEPTQNSPVTPLFSSLARWRLAVIERLGAGELPQMLLWAALVGVLGACATLLFTACIHTLLWLITGIWGNPEQAAAAISVRVRPWIPAIGGVIAGAILVFGRRFYRTQAGGDYMEAIVIGNRRISVPQTMVRSISSLVSIGTGASIGREGPMVQMAAMLGSVMARISNLPAPRKRLLIACGASAGLTAAYNAPVAGALFVGEIVLGSIATESFGPLLVAAVFSNLTTQQFFALEPLYSIPPVSAISSPLEVLWYLALGTVMGLFAPMFLRLLELSKAAFDATGVALPLRLGVGGLIVGCLSIAAPEVWGNGYSIVTDILIGKYFGVALLVIVVLKLAATTTTVGSGAIGGVFTPTLFVGSALGALLGGAMHDISPLLVPNPLASAAVAMGAFLAATTHAPLMSILMIFEMTASDAVILPLMLACVPAYVAAKAIRRDSIYSVSLRKEAARQAAEPAFATLAIKDIFRPEAPTVDISASLAVVAAAFAEHRFQYLYVTDATAHYFGVVSLHDLRPLLDDPKRSSAITAADMLVTGFQQLAPGMTLEAALVAFSHHRGERLPVVSDEGFLLGAAWKTDVMLALHESLGRKDRDHESEAGEPDDALAGNESGKAATASAPEER